MTRAVYPSDLTEAQWKILKPLIPKAKPGGRPRTVDMREILNALFYVARTGCAWRQLPHDLPPWSTVYDYFRQWRQDGTWQRLHDALRDKVRKQAGRKKSPSAAVIDSPSVKTTEKGGSRATTRARRSTAANATSSSIPWG
jgi:putative transposase